MRFSSLINTMLKVALALFISIMLHVLMMQALVWYLALTPKVKYQAPLANLNMVLAMPQAQKTIAQPTNNDAATIGHDSHKDDNLIDHARQEAMNNDAYMAFYSNKEVDRKALPQNAIDEFALNELPYSGLPIQLRLFINAAGRLVKIERIGVLDQDDLFVSTLEQLLYQTTFLPARRDRMDVNSYQEVQFSFEPSATMITHH